MYDFLIQELSKILKNYNSIFLSNTVPHWNTIKKNKRDLQLVTSHLAGFQIYSFPKIIFFKDLAPE